jgi:hypothetical protein
MPMDRFLIAPFKTGQQQDVRPWLILDDAFQELNNAYVFRGRVRKRPGSSVMNTSVPLSIQQLYTRLRVGLGTTDADGDASSSAPGYIYQPGQMFSIGDAIFTVKATGNLLIAPILVGTTNSSGNASGTIYETVGSVGMVFTIAGFTYTVAVANGALTPGIGAPGSGTFNTATGAFTFTGTTASSPIYLIPANPTPGDNTFDTTTGAFVFTNSYPSTRIYFYPALPVMGFATYDSDLVEDEPLFAFDTEFPYLWDSTNQFWNRVGTAVWTGSNLNYFWCSTWRGLTNFNYYLFVSNFKNPNNSPGPDYIKYYNQSDFYNLNPVLNQTSRLVTALMVQPFKDRLCVYNVWESTSGSGISQGTTDGTTGNVTVNPVTAFNGNAYMIGDNFLVGTSLFTVIDVTTNADVAMLVNSQTSSMTAPISTGTFNGTTGKLVITGNGTNLNQPVYYISIGTPTAYRQYWNRLRFSQNGTPVPSNPLYPSATNAWLDTVPGLGGYIDAPTKEAIVSGEYIKDRWIVYFETSTWEQVYTFNQVLPFVWQKINTELGAVSPFSTVPFDKVVIGIGDVGVHACNGSNVERIDDLIPDSIFNFAKENGGNLRVWGVRDYYTEMIYWAFQTEQRYIPFNNKLLAYNYKTQSWAFFDDAVTAFGTFYNSTNITWASSTFPWEQAYQQWNTGSIQQQFRQVIAGNQQGYTFLIQREEGSNAPALQITNMVITSADTSFTVTCYNHCLSNGQFVYFENCPTLTNINNTVYEVGVVSDQNTILFFAVNGKPISGTYAGGGTLRRVSQIDILTKQYNFYIKDGRNALINKVDFQLDKTTASRANMTAGIQNGVTVDWYLNTSEESSIQAGGSGSIGTGTITGTGILETTPYPASPYSGYPTSFENDQQQLWHPIYLWADGEYIQLHIYMSDAQMLNIDVAWADFQLHSYVFYTQPSSSRLQ